MINGGGRMSALKVLLVAGLEGVGLVRLSAWLDERWGTGWWQSVPPPG